MKVIVDTNILFSAILNSSGLIGEVLFNSGNQFQFYAPEFAESELAKYHEKLMGLTKMNSDQIFSSKRQVIKNIVLISEEAIPLHSWKQAHELTKSIDTKDTPFVATAIALNGVLWTGDKKLIKGLLKKGLKNVIDTAQLSEKIG